MHPCVKQTHNGESLIICLVIILHWILKVVQFLYDCDNCYGCICAIIGKTFILFLNLLLHLRRVIKVCCVVSLYDFCYVVFLLYSMREIAFSFVVF